MVLNSILFDPRARTILRVSQRYNAWIREISRDNWRHRCL